MKRYITSNRISHLRDIGFIRKSIQWFNSSDIRKINKQSRPNRSALLSRLIVPEQKQVTKIVAAFGRMVDGQAQVDALVDGVGKDLLHVVEMRLRHIDAV